MIESAPSPVPRASFAIRDHEGCDMDAIMAVMGSAFPATYGEAWTRSQCAGILPMAGVALRVAADDCGTITGFALSRAVADEAELLLIAVDPTAQNQGIGASLLEDFVAFARSRGAVSLHLEVRDGNSAILLYERAGFSLAGRRRDYYRGSDGQTRDALTLTLEL